MITRIVRLEFQPEEVSTFLAQFDQYKKQIRHFPGVHHLELHRDAVLENVYFTYSIWEDDAALEAYRHSELFKEVWAKTKVLFAGKPKAWSLLKQMQID